MGWSERERLPVWASLYLKVSGKSVDPSTNASSPEEAAEAMLDEVSAGSAQK